MSTNEDIIQLINALPHLFPIKIIEKNHEFIFNVEGIKKTFTIKEDQIVANIEKLKKMKQDENILYSDKSYECLVRFRYPGRIMRLHSFSEKIEIQDDLNKISYGISSASSEYMIYLIMRLHDSKDINLKEYYEAHLKPNIYFTDNVGKYFKKRETIPEKPSKEDLFDCIGHIFNYKTIKICAEDTLRLDDFKNLKDAFLYNICYNFNLPIIEVKSLQDIFVSGRARGFRRKLNMQNLAPPKLFYVPDLINHYQTAISSDNSVYEYLSFYHIIEHFFEIVYNENLIMKVKHELTKPGFSYKEDSDVKKLIEITRKSIKQFKEENTLIDERSALTLTLKKYVDLNELKDDLNEYNPDLLNYYKDNAVTFSKGEPFNFNESLDTIYKKLASRVYKTRNSIVHSKKSDEQFYNHLKDEGALNKEIPLVRFIAEQIISRSSRIIEIH